MHPNLALLIISIIFDFRISILGKHKAQRVPSQFASYRRCPSRGIWLKVVSFDSFSLKGEARRFLAYPPPPHSVRTRFSAKLFPVLTIRNTISKRSQSSVCDFSLILCCKIGKVAMNHKTCFQWRSEHFWSGLFFNKRKGFNELSARLENVLSELLRHCAIFLI